MSKELVNSTTSTIKVFHLQLLSEYINKSATPPCRKAVSLLRPIAEPLKFEVGLREVMTRRKLIPYSPVLIKVLALDDHQGAAQDR